MTTTMREDEKRKEDYHQPCHRTMVNRGQQGCDGRWVDADDADEDATINKCVRERWTTRMTTKAMM